MLGVLPDGQRNLLCPMKRAGAALHPGDVPHRVSLLIPSLNQ